MPVCKLENRCTRERIEKVGWASGIGGVCQVPTLYHDLLADPAFADADTSSVRKLGFAGQAMTDGLLRRLDSAFRPDLFVNHCGSSEIYTLTMEPARRRRQVAARGLVLHRRYRLLRRRRRSVRDRPRR